MVCGLNGPTLQNFEETGRLEVCLTGTIRNNRGSHLINLSNYIHNGKKLTMNISISWTTMFHIICCTAKLYYTSFKFYIGWNQIFSEEQWVLIWTIQKGKRRSIMAFNNFYENFLLLNLSVNMHNYWIWVKYNLQMHIEEPVGVHGTTNCMVHFHNFCSL